MCNSLKEYSGVLLGLLFPIHIVQNLFLKKCQVSLIIFFPLLKKCHVYWL